MECEYVLQCLEENNVLIMKKKFHNFLSYDQNGIYIGERKTSLRSV